MKNNRYLILGFAAVLSLSACEKIVHQESFMAHDLKMQASQDRIFETFDTHQVNSALVGKIVQHYERYGTGGIDLHASYDPRSSSNTALRASDHLLKITRDFEEQGLSNIRTSVVPVEEQGSRVLVSYETVNVTAHEDCTMMPGIENRNIDTDEDYKIGCTRDAIFAKQVARPKDLLGRGASGDLSDGRRAANIVEGYRTGAQNQELSGESASE